MENKQSKKTNKSFENKLKNDSRFASISSDPKFMTAPKEVKKVKVDKRFNKMLTDKSFVSTAQRDKFEKIYDFEEKDESHSEDEEDENEHILDQDGNFVWNEQSDSSSQEAEEDDEENVMSEVEDVKYGDEQGTRIAVQNLDWDHIGASDLFFLFTSFCKGESIVQKVEIYPSEYGKQMMERDSLYGPPKEIFDKGEHHKKAKNRIKKKQKKLENSVIPNLAQALEENDNYEFNEMALRKYEIQKMKYFFAVVYCDSAHTANLLYNEIDGLEFELSNLRMDLRFIPDSLTEFPYPPKEVCYEVPDEYECNFFVNRAIGHTKVKLTWDQDDPKQIKIIKKKFNDDQIEQQDLRDYLASSGGEESDDPEEVNRKRALLGLNNDSESDEEINNAIGTGKSKNKPYSNQNAKGDIKITFKSGFEDIGKNLIEAKKEKDEMKDESAFDKFQRERKQKKEKRN